MKKCILSLLGLVALLGSVNAQVKSTEIWVADIQLKEGKTVVANPVRITNNDFYDNQPSWSKDGNLIWFASMPDTIQADIYEYNLKKREFRQVTNTTESEYQPMQIPAKPNRLSIVRVEADKAQRFFSVSMDGTDWEILAQNEDSVAYYCWMNDTTLGMNLLDGAGGVLEQYDFNIQQAIILANGGFGRCLARIPGTDDLSYVLKNKNGKNMLMAYHMASGDRDVIAELLPEVEDYAWAPDGKIYCADRTAMYYYDTKADNNKWQLAAEFSKTVGTMYRLSVSPKGDKIAIVSYKGTKP